MITIRATQPDDLSALYALWQEQVNLLAQSEGRTPSAQPAAWMHAMHGQLNDPRVFCLTAVNPADGSLPGYLLASEAGIGALPGMDSRVGLIHELAIDLHRYHPGLARALVEEARAEFARRGVGRVIAFSPRHAVISQAFWRASGATRAFDGFILS
jgi:predicted N-acetyltransferase YhbS